MRSNRFFVAAFFIFVLIIWACKHVQEYRLAVPEGWSVPEIPADKQLSADRVYLGRKLFFDPILSPDSSMSCASCHKPSLAFADSVPVSAGVHGAMGFRNTPTLFNVAWQPYFFAEGGVPDLEILSAAPIQTQTEMAFNLGEAVRRLESNPEYVRLFQRAYKRNPDTYSLTRALGAFQRSLISGNSRYDRFIRGDSSVLSTEERMGMNLFFSERTGCSDCHSGFLFTDFGFYSLGYYSDGDPGRFRLTSKEADRGRFKTPTLRNIAVTAPYLHDGSLATLDEIVHFYNQGGGPLPGRDSRMEPLGLSDREINQLTAFLRTLTDSFALSNPDYLPLP